jgi:hypothetical protein
MHQKTHISEAVWTRKVQNEAFDQTIALAVAGASATILFRRHPAVFLIGCFVRFVGDLGMRLSWAGTVKNSNKVPQNHANRWRDIICSIWKAEIAPVPHTQFLRDSKLN